MRPMQGKAGSMPSRPGQHSAVRPLLLHGREMCDRRPWLPWKTAQEAPRRLLAWAPSHVNVARYASSRGPCTHTSSNPRVCKSVQVLCAPTFSKRLSGPRDTARSLDSAGRHIRLLQLSFPFDGSKPCAGRRHPLPFRSSEWLITSSRASQCRS